MFKIVKDTNPNLRRPCLEVPLPLTEEDGETLKQMLDYLKKSQDPDFLKSHPSVRSGVGLAAPQIGINKRMIAVYFEEAGKEVTHLLANPKIVASSVRMAYLSGGEGCLSVDSPHPGPVYRPYKITVKAFDAIAGKERKIVARGYESIVLQHEIDHLDGILFYDHIGKKDPSIDYSDAIEI
ncbi:MAG: peptide deformylase [Firmicutes bacterium]|uniref:Peptide deformylase n=1 Tax=Candidatus Alloenteromonas pullistercoris TaxID=2840785 RepID=A0A9D9GWC4_9FIRM|nr:peptide deformylase [Candidatus Enteromonas pullistercoris]